MASRLGPSELQAVYEGALAAGPATAAERLQDVERALQQAPNAAGLWHAKGRLHALLDNNGEALPAYTRAQQLAPQHAGVALARAGAMLDAGLPAVDAFAQVLALSPGNPNALLGLTDALLAEGRTQDAIAGLESLMAKVPGWTPGHEMLARTRWMEGEREGFARSFAAGLTAEPQNLDLRRSQFNALIQAGQYEDARQAIAHGREAIGDTPLFQVNEAVIEAEHGDVDRAERLFAPFADMDDPFTQVRRMRMYLRAGRPAKAAAIFDAFADHQERELLIPYAAVAWRMLDDPRWDWLEGDPRFVGIYDLADRLPPLDELATHLRSLHRVRGQQLDQSVRGGTQTEGNLLSHVHPILQHTARVIREAVARHVAQLPPPDPRHPLLQAPRHRPIRFAGSWSVRLTSGGHHSNHIHPMGWLSSAMYIGLPATSDAEREAREGWLTLGEPQRELGVAVSPFRTVEPRPGRLVLFPSTMWHGTVPFGRTDGERLTIAFDVARPE